MATNSNTKKQTTNEKLQKECDEKIEVQEVVIKPYDPATETQTPLEKRQESLRNLLQKDSSTAYENAELNDETAQQLGYANLKEFLEAQAAELPGMKKQAVEISAHIDSIMNV